VLQSVIWQNVGWDTLPEFWQVTIRELMGELEDKTASQLVEHIVQQEETWREQLAFTGLMREYNSLQKERRVGDKDRRPMSKEDDAAGYEKDWDERLLAILRRYRLAPTGYDPMMSFWYGKELEGKQLRLLLSAKLNSMSGEELYGFKRSRYRAL